MTEGPPGIDSPEALWEDMAADRDAALLLGIPLADDDLEPRAAPVAAVPIRRRRRRALRLEPGTDTRIDLCEEQPRAA